MRRLLLFVAAVLLAVGTALLLSSRVAGLPPLGALLDPADGLYRTARQAAWPGETRLGLAALEAPVTLVRDRRGVPHIFAESDRDATITLGYAVARDRLFQLDFFSRVASGRMAEALGAQAVETDRFLRRTGMDWGAKKNLARIKEEGGIEWDLIRWYAAGVNAYFDGLAEEDLPLEFRLLDYRPARFRPLDALRLLQYMSFDLTWGTDSPQYALLRRRLSEAEYRLLYPRFARLFVPVIPQDGEVGPAVEALPSGAVEALGAWAAPRALRQRLRGTAAEGFLPGKGSNNWAVHAGRSATGAPLLSSDMHLSLWLPAIWYEAHLVTPTMNSYGVTIPGAPLPVEAFNDCLGWTFTNTGADQIDHLALTLDDAGERYRYEGAWRELDTVVDTIRVKGAEPVLDTLYYAHWGPVFKDRWEETGSAVAVRWVVHDSSRTLAALWGMNRARSAAAFEDALRRWDTPMQNILYATSEGDIAIRSTGYLPLRRHGTGAGLLDGASDSAEWVGRVPFEELPHARNPARGYLTSTNQQPTDSTYEYYLGHDWRDGWRSLRIDALLHGKPRHGLADFKRYQRDVRAVQRDAFVSFIDTLSGLDARADTLRQMLSAWDGETTTDRPEPLVLDEFLRALRVQAWDEAAFGGDVPRPTDATLLKLLEEQPRSKWLDIAKTPEREDAAGLLRRAMEATADTLAEAYGWGPRNWEWGEHHGILFRHLTGSERLRPLWRGPTPHPGFDATLAPAGQRPTTHSASWRMIVDFSQTPPKGWGIYPGGQSGNPFSRLYDEHLAQYLAFEYYELLKPEAPDDLAPGSVHSRTELLPTE